MPKRPRLAITTGEPAGIGPEISLRAAWALRDNVIPILIGDAALLSGLARAIDPAMSLEVLASGTLPQDETAKPDRLFVLDCPLVHAAQAGHLDAANSVSVLQMLDIAIAGTQNGDFDAIVKAPVAEKRDE